MPKKRKSKRVATAAEAPAASYAPVTAAAPRASAAAFVLGLLFLLVSTAASFVLVYQHVTGQAIPGCGPGSACAQLAEGFGGKIPLGTFAWPTAYAGAAYFAAALLAWIVAGGALPGVLRWVARLGVLGSVFFCIVILVKWMLCQYCLVAHIGNFAFWITLEFARGRPRRGGPAVAAALVMFALASAGIGVWDAAVQRQVARDAEQQRTESVQAIIEASQAPRPTPSASQAVEPDEPVVQPPVEPNPTSGPAPESVPAPPAEPARPFTGRYRLGPELAPIRIVMITDYQCRDCRRVEDEVMAIVHSRDDVSASIKHYPFSSDCNPHVPRNMHRNACWAARAAETAGLLHGNDGFWKMHAWLFARGGGFTNQELEQALRQFGFDPQPFYATMQSARVNELIAADCAEAADLGLFFTPMVFINGVEFRGWHAPQAVARTINELVAANLPARTAAADHPPLALEKAIEDWRAWEPLYGQGRFSLPPDAQAWTLGTGTKVDIVVWGDYQEEGTARVDEVIRAWLAAHPEARYTYRHYPFNSECNANIPFRRHPLACWAARAAEAAGRLGGNDGYWRMHAWLMENYDAALRVAAQQAGVDAAALKSALYVMTADERAKGCAELGVQPDAILAAMDAEAERTLRADAPELGVEIDLLLAEMQSPDIQARIDEDIEAAKRLPMLRWGTRPGLHAIPTIFVNGRYVMRHQLGERLILTDILAAAARE